MVSMKKLCFVVLFYVAGSLFGEPLLKNLTVPNSPQESLDFSEIDPMSQELFADLLSTAELADSSLVIARVATGTIDSPVVHYFEATNLYKHLFNAERPYRTVNDTNPLENPFNRQPIVGPIHLFAIENSNENTLTYLGTEHDLYQGNSPTSKNARAVFFSSFSGLPKTERKTIKTRLLKVNSGRSPSIEHKLFSIFIIIGKSYAAKKRIDDANYFLKRVFTSDAATNLQRVLAIIQFAKLYYRGAFPYNLTNLHDVQSALTRGLQLAKPGDSKKMDEAFSMLQKLDVYFDGFVTRTQSAAPHNAVRKQMEINRVIKKTTDYAAQSTLDSFDPYYCIREAVLRLSLCEMLSPDACYDQLVRARSLLTKAVSQARDPEEALFARVVLADLDALPSLNQYSNQTRESLESIIADKRADKYYHVRAHLSLAELETQREDIWGYQSARKRYELVIESGLFLESLQAKNRLAYLYQHGLGTYVDLAKAQKLYEAVIEQNIAILLRIFAQYQTAQILRMLGGNENYIAARELLETIITENESASTTLMARGALGLMYYFGEGDLTQIRNYRVARLYLSGLQHYQSLDDYERICLVLGIMKIRDFNDGALETEEGIHLINNVANQQKDPWAWRAAHATLAEYYFAGKVFERNFATARVHYQNALTGTEDSLSIRAREQLKLMEELLQQQDQNPSKRQKTDTNPDELNNSL